MGKVQKISRRDFLRAGACAGLAVIASPLLRVPLVEASKLKKEVEKFQIGDTKVKILVFKKGKSDTVYFAPHGDESNAFKAGVKAVNKNGGTFIMLPNHGVRVVVFKLGSRKYAFDANRCFSDEGIKLSLEKWGKIRNDCDGYSEEAHEAIKPFADFLKKKFDSKVVIGVHGNTDGAYVTEEEMNAADSYWNPDMDKDDFFLVLRREHFDYLKEKKMNVILESEDVDDDGSLSLYCRANCIPYINVEAQYEHVNEQMLMLKEARKMLDNFYSGF